MKQIISGSSHPAWNQASLSINDGRIHIHVTLGPGDMSLVAGAIKTAQTEYRPWILANFEPIAPESAEWRCLHCQADIKGSNDFGAVESMHLHLINLHPLRIRSGNL